MRSFDRKAARAGWLLAFGLCLGAAAPVTDREGDAFLWGVSTSAYQVEGGYRQDGKGKSNWDVYTNDFQITKAVIGEKETGNIADNLYDRKQYLEDIQLMKHLGVNAYRFSIAWSRILPDGTGEVNPAGIAHYRQFIDDLLANGIEPVVTIYHWDMPEKLAERGGWADPRSVDWFKRYAEVVFDAFGDRVKRFITVNEPFVELFMIEPSVHHILEGVADDRADALQVYAQQAVAAHHILLASAQAIHLYRELGLKGEIGISLNFTPTIPADRSRVEDVEAASMMDALQNRWFLDAIFKGRYPQPLASMQGNLNPDFVPTAAELRSISENRPDFVGVNYYAPSYFKADPAAPLGADWAKADPGTLEAFNGPVVPDELYRLLMRLHSDYGDPIIYITENGAGFGGTDEDVVEGRVHDELRGRYLREHIAAALKARAAGARLRGYFVWSLLDNFEWTTGYSHRLGIVHVDFDTQLRLPKESFFEYQRLIASHPRG
ncbi:MAG: family 1 glycosylhydrolase [Hyphomicrobiales bacterium]|nr:family 1 glycosylhydrolase [Hyphomicrobiales bacterium]